MRRAYGRALGRLREMKGHTQESAAEACTPTMSSQNFGRYEIGGAAGITDPLTRRRLLASIGATEEEFQTVLEEIGGQEPRSARLARMATAAGGVAEAGLPFSADRRQAVFPLSDGDLVVSYPRNLSPEAKREMKRFLELLLATNEND